MFGNQYGVQTRPLFQPSSNRGNLDSPQDSRPEATQTKTYHGLQVNFSSGVSTNGQRLFQSPVGRIQSWTPQMYARNGTSVFELGCRSWGRPVDYVPGPGTNYTIECSRVELWSQEIELLVGHRRWADLVAQREPFMVTESLWRDRQPYQTFEYRGCWFQAKNEEAQTSMGNAQVIVNCTIAFVSRIQTL